MATALLLISFQSNYFNKKNNPKIKGIKKSARAALKLLEYFRENDLPIVHILQTGGQEEFSAENLKPHDMLEPKNEESLLVTGMGNAFADQKLGQILKKLKADHLLIAGLTAEKQILYTVLAAKELNYSSTVAHDACAAASLKINGEKIKAEVVQKAIMAVLANSGAAISTAKEFIKGEQKKLKKIKKEAAKQMAIQEAAKAALEAASVPMAEEPFKKNGRKKERGVSKAEELPVKS